MLTLERIGKSYMVALTDRGETTGYVYQSLGEALCVMTILIKKLQPGF